ncbi:MAG: hypothetical protein EXR21_09615 [Flavobacteriaceae bacterium]|nr:hypothetical protein [Flavobacteriaceae bacterium]
MRKKIVSLFLLLGVFQSQAQYGNEWITYGQKYYKIKIWQEGIYAIKYSDLQAAGLSTAQIAAIDVPDIQMYYRGNQIPLWISSSGLNFSTTDRIEFYGQPNDGKLDQKLYRKPEEQPHAFKSLYTDTAVYYLTWSDITGGGKRYQDVNKTNYSSMTAENYYMFNQFVPMYTTYQYGRTGIIYDEAQSSDYTQGEGWVGGSWRRQTNSTPSGFGYQTFDIQLPNIYTGGPDAELYSKVYGSSNGTSAMGSAYKHHLQINTKAKNAATTVWDTIMDTLFYFHGEIICKKPVANAKLSDSIFQVRYWGPNDQGLNFDNKYISHIEMNYPRKFDMRGQTIWSFSLRGNGSSDIYLNWANSSSTAANGYFYDVENGYRCQSTNTGSTQQVILPGALADRRVFAADVANQLSLPSAPIPYTFSPINTAANYNYLIISHSKLATGANAYKTNREAAGYKVLVVYADSLYDHFHYGQHSPMALRNFCNYMVNVPAKKADYLLLIGKGIECNRLLSGGKHNGGILAIDRVPTWGYPGTDILLSAGLDGNGFAPAFATGRLAADSVEQVTDYIKKMVQYEKELAFTTNTASIWKKNILHLCGGRTEQETQNLLYYMNLLKPLVAKDSFGGVVKTYAKYDAAPITSSLKEAIRKDLNDGVGMVYYYGHGAADLLEIDIGDLKEVSNARMPVMMFAGCILGNSYSDKTFLGERWIFPKDRKEHGAIAWIANTHYGFVSPLADYAKNFYNQMMKESYGKSIGLAQIEAIKNYQDSNDKYNEFHCKQIVIQGDPSVKLFSPAYPEYYVHRSSISVSPITVTSATDSFALKIIVRNQGKAFTDTIKVQVSQVLPNSQRIEHTSIFIPAPYNTDTVTFWIDQRNLNTKGTNRFTVHVNPNIFPDKYINENGRYGNNKDSIEFYMPGNGASIIFPYNYSLLSSTTAQLIATSINQTAGKETFVFQVDTNYQFSSSYLDSQRVSSSGLATGSFNLLNKDTQVYYWRVRIDKPIAEGGRWQTASFTYIKNSGNGWAQADIPQMLASSNYRTVIDEAARTLDFATTSSNTYWMASFGKNVPFGISGRLFRKNSGTNFAIRDPAKGGGQVGNGFGFIAMNPVNENPLRLQNFWGYRYYYQTSNPLYYNTTGNWRGSNQPQDTTPALYIFNTQIDSQRAAMAVFINDSIPDGYRVMVIKGDNPGFSKWSNSDFDLFKKIGGSGIIKKVGEDWPYILKGTKGQPAKGREQTADPNNPIYTADRQGVKDFDQLGPRFIEGNMQSEMAGPAKSWTKFYKQHTGYDDPLDTAWYSLVFIDKTGTENELFSNITDDSMDISGVDASIYPWMKVKMMVRDSGQTRSPLQPNYWIVNYQGVPEGTVLLGAKAPFVVNPKDTISEGDSAFYRYGFTNISQSDMDSVFVEVKLTDHLNNVTTLISRKLEPMPAKDTVFVEGGFDTKPYPAGNTLTVTFNPGFAQLEQYNYNNTYQAKFFCKRDFENPMLDVVFDGVRIFDGDIVSANPIITISAKDENKNFLITNHDNVKLYITYPKQAEQEITSSSPDFTFSAADPNTRKATVTFTPKALPDGDQYKLRAQAYDVAGNAAGSGSYEVRFKVVNKSMISRFYPYPNPFSTKAKFVFTLTGNEVPDQMRIRIMTVSGQVVKEILKEELGPIHIGNNITQYAWDGTDEFGDKLANGVYLYQVTARLNGKDIDLNTESDPSLATNEQFFKKGIGKIVILR